MGGALLLAAGVGFLLGSIPFAWLVVRLRTGRDLAASGSGNVGALNSLRVSRSVATGALVLLLDAAKGVAAAWLAPRLFAGAHADLAAVVGAVAGHAYNPWLTWARRRLTGGKGFATAAGGFLVTAPWLVVAWLGAVALAYGAFRAGRGIRDEAPASLVATLGVPLAGLLVYGPPEGVAGLGLVVVTLPRLLPEVITVWRTRQPVTPP